MPSVSLYQRGASEGRSRLAVVAPVRAGPSPKLSHPVTTGGAAAGPAGPSASDDASTTTAAAVRTARDDNPEPGRASSRSRGQGWQMGLEPTTAGTTTRS